MTYFNFNGKLLAEHTPIIGADNRGLRYGDGLFETILFKNESFVLLDEHLARLWNGMKLLQFELPRLFTPDLLEAEMHHLVKKNKHPHARIRLTILRGDGGLYDAQNHAPQYIIQSWSLPQSSGSINENGLISTHC